MLLFLRWEPTKLVSANKKGSNGVTAQKMFCQFLCLNWLLEINVSERFQINPSSVTETLHYKKYIPSWLKVTMPTSSTNHRLTQETYRPPPKSLDYMRREEWENPRDSNGSVSRSSFLQRERHLDSGPGRRVRINSDGCEQRWSKLQQVFFWNSTCFTFLNITALHTPCNATHDAWY